MTLNIPQFLCKLATGSILIMQCASGMAESAMSLEAHEDYLNSNPQLSLRQVLEATIARNPQQHVLGAMAGIAQAREVQAKGFLPAAPAMLFRHQNDTVGSNRGEREWEVEMEMPVWLPGQRAARDVLAKDTASGIGSSRNSLLLQVAGVLREAVWDVRMSQESEMLFESRLKTAQKLEQDVARRFRAGELAKTDLMLAQNETLQAEAAWVRAQAEVKHAKHRYIALTGLNEMPANADEALSPLTDLSDQHALLEEANARITIARDERHVADVERRDAPQFVLSARSQRGPSDNFYNDGIGFKVRIPFASDVRNAPLLANAESNIAAVMTERDKLRLSMETALHEAEHSLLVTRKELELVTKQNQITQESVQLARKAFRLGETDLVSLLRSESQAFEAERALSGKRIQLQRDVARYNQAVGVLP